MQAGKLNRPISILAQTTTKDAEGGLVDTWTEIAQTWASIDVQESARIYETAEFMSKVKYRITVRYRMDVVIDSSRRVQYIEPTTNITHVYQIAAPTNTQTANRELILMCFELQGEE